MEDLKAKLEVKGIKISKISDLVKNSEIFALIDSNKSKAKKTIVEKIKKFYYLHIYYRFSKLGNYDEYTNVMQNELNSLEAKKVELENNRDEKLVEIAKQDDIKPIDLDQIQMLGENTKKELDKVDKKIEKSTENMSIVSQKHDQDVNEQKKSSNEEVNAIGQNQIENAINQSTEQIKQNVREIKNENSKQENSLDNKLKGIQEQCMINISRYVQNAIEQTRNECKIYYDGMINTIIQDSKKAVLTVKEREKQLTIEKNNSQKEAEQYKSHYEQIVEISENQTREINEKDNEISSLKETVEIVQKEKQQYVTENEELKVQLASLNKTLAAYKLTFSNLIEKTSEEEQQVSYSENEETKIR